MTKSPDTHNFDLQVNRNYKDGLFHKLFSDKEGALELYNALNESSYEDPDLLEITTIENILYMGIKNDLAFLIEGQMHLLEAQSTWSPNMPLRGLFYFSNLYQGYVAKNELDIYSHRLLRLPKPVYIVFYNGLTDMPEQTQLRLSDSFEDGCMNSAIEVTARVFNINYGKNRRLMERCQRLHDYAYLIQQVRHHIDNGLKLEAAIDRAVNDCIQQNILKPFLLKHRGEVSQMILTEYNAALHIRSEKQISYEEGEQRGMQIGEQRGAQKKTLEIIRSMLSKGASLEYIREILNTTEKEWDELLQLLKEK